MAVEIGTLEKHIKEALPGSRVVITDLQGDGEHYAAYVEAEQFRGHSRVRQHQMIYEALEGIEVHALALRTVVPGSGSKIDWAREQDLRGAKR